MVCCASYVSTRAIWQVIFCFYGISMILVQFSTGNCGPRRINPKDFFCETHS